MAKETGLLTRFATGVLATGTGTALTLIIGLLSISIAVRYLSKEAVGTYLLLQVIVNFMLMVGDFGLSMSVVRLIAGTESKESGVEGQLAVSTLITVKLAVAVVMTLAVVVLKGGLELLFDNRLLFEVALFLPVLYILEDARGFMTSVLQGLHKYTSIALSGVIISVVNLVAILVLVCTLDFGMTGLIWARMIALGVALVYMKVKVPYCLRPSFHRGVAERLARFGYPLGLNNILTFVFMKMDMFLIGMLLSPVGVAYYGTASRIPDAGRQLFESFRAVFYPNLSELFYTNRKVEAEAVLNASLRIVSFAAMFITLAVIVFQTQIVLLLFSESYLESAPVLALLMVALAVGLVGNVLGTSLVAAGYSRLPAIINIVDAVVNISANLILIPIYGVMGAAMAALLARAATNPVNVFFLKKKGIAVNSLEYLKPAGVFLICLALRYVDGSGSFVNGSLVLFLFLILSVRCDIITVADLSATVACILKNRRSRLNEC